MRDLGLVAFLLTLLGLGFRRPFLFVLAYSYVDIVAPQRLSYYMLNSIPVSAVCFLAAIGGWLMADSKKGVTFSPRQMLLVMLLAWAWYTTSTADLPAAAAVKWEWVWKALLFAIFLPLMLRTPLRMEAQLVFMTLSAASIMIVGGLKTLASGGGYGALNLLISSNSGLYESSTASTVAIAIIPVILFLSHHGTIFPQDKRVRLFCWSLIFACLLIPIGTQARTGLLCIVALAMLVLRSTKRRMLYITLIGIGTMITIPLLPQSYTARMNTISGYQSDNSASTRIAVWAWTLNYVQHHPFGGGFEAYRQNKIIVTLQDKTQDSGGQVISTSVGTDQGRAYHSAYFEMLGEQGFPGLIIWGLFHLSGLLRMEQIRNRYKRMTDRGEWIAALATALQNSQIICLVGSLFVGIAFQPFILMLMGVQIALSQYVRNREKTARATMNVFGTMTPAASGPAQSPQAS